MNVDFYSHLRDLKVCSDQAHFVSLWPYYDPKQGWKKDSINEVVSLLHKIRFFNRFGFETLMLLIKRVTMRQLKKGSVLYLEEGESAILLSGKLHLMCYKDDLHRPYVARLYHPGDLIGLDKIDGGWSTEQHSWVCALQDCDVFYISTTYLDMLWDKMKKFQSNLVAEIL